MNEINNNHETANGTKLLVMCRLTPAQKREYELLKKNGSVYVYGWQRRGVYERLKEKGLCYSQDWNWFHLNGTKPMLPAGRLKERILSVLANRQGKFSAVDIADEIGYPIDGFGCLSTCKNVRVILTKLCKEGLLYQWITGNGLSPFSLTNTAKYSVDYLRRDSNLAKTLLEHPNRTLVGYRIR